MKKDLLTSILCALLALFVGGFTVCCRAGSEVHVQTAGTLASLLPTTERELKVTGVINGTDVKYLRQLVSAGKVTALDLEGVRIISGGDAYYDTFKTENDVLGPSMFRECTRLRTIVLPTSVSAIDNNAFSNSGLQEVEIPDRVTRLGMDAFAYCSSLATVVIGSHVTQMGQGVFYSSPVRNAYVKPLAPPTTPAYLFSSNPSIKVYSDVLDDYKQSSWTEYGKIVGGLEDLYPQPVDSTELMNQQLSTFFEDAACTTLKAEYQAMSDEALSAAMTEAELPGWMVAIALKVKNQAWVAYEQDFRIHSYAAYSDASYWNTLLKSSGGSYMGNPTGIFTDSTAPLYVFVDDDVPADATLYMAGCVGNDLITSAKTGTRLKKGLNIVEGPEKALFYVLYTADTREKTKPLAQWPRLKIHIEGGRVNGYYDPARYTEQDYVSLLRAARHERFTVKGSQALFNFKTTTYRSLFPRHINQNICWFDSLTVWEKELMGFCANVAAGERAGAPHCLTGGEAIFPIYYNNPNFAIEGEEGDAGSANSTPFRTSYNSVTCVRNSFDVSRDDHDDWCAGHECGHNNQQAINLEGGTEVSNNLFSNVVRYLTGHVTTAGTPVSTTMDSYAHRVPYFVRSVDEQMRMYYQLYLYYHQAQKNTAFYPTLFQELRKDPLQLWTNSNQSSLKFVRKVCEVAQEDLTDFFTVWGFFEPCRNLQVEDYGAHTMTVRQTDINRTLAEIAKYPKKNRAILFIEDRAQNVATRDFVTTGGQKRRGSEVVGQYANLGQFTDYMDGHTQPSAYTYLRADSLYAMSGSGGVGFVVLDQDEKLVYAANTLNFCIPTSLGTDFTLWSIDADGTLHPATYVGEGAEEVWLNQAGTLADSLSATAIKATIGGNVNGTDIKLMRQLISEGNLASLDLTEARILNGGSAYYENYRSTLNTLGSHAFHGLYRLISIRLPEKLTKIDDNAFSNSGLREARIPDGVTSVGVDAFAYCSSLRQVVVGSKVKSMAQGVFYNSAVSHAFVKPLTPPTISPYLFSSHPTIHVYASALAAYKASGWAEYGTIVGDLDEYEELTAVQDLREEGSAPTKAAPVYDLTGRRVTRLQPATIYLQGGRKFILPQ